MKLQSEASSTNNDASQNTGVCNGRISAGYLTKRKKILLISMAAILLISVLILIIFALFSNEGRYSFRKTNWGMSQDEVINSEDILPEIQEASSIFYLHLDDEILENEMVITQYNFSEKDGECVLSSIFVAPYEDKTIFSYSYDDIAAITNKLDKKYGKHERNIYKNLLWQTKKTTVIFYELDDGSIAIEYRANFE